MGKLKQIMKGAGVKTGGGLLAIVISVLLYTLDSNTKHLQREMDIRSAELKTHKENDVRFYRRLFKVMDRMSTRIDFLYRRNGGQ